VTVSFGAALMAGLLSFLSPCVLPLVPGYIGFLGGLGKRSNDVSNQAKTILSRWPEGGGPSLSELKTVGAFRKRPNILPHTATQYGVFYLE